MRYFETGFVCHGQGLLNEQWLNVQGMISSQYILQQVATYWSVSA